MGYRFNRGMGRTVAQDRICQTEVLQGFFDPACWSALELPVIGTAPAPTGDALTLPPASGEDAAALQQSLADEAMRRQQGIDAAQVQTNWLDRFSSGAVDTGNALNPFDGGPGGLSWLLWGALGVGAFALVTLATPGPRRYGR